jgi:hypothetical protein
VVVDGWPGIPDDRIARRKAQAKLVVMSALVFGGFLVLSIRRLRRSTCPGRQQRQQLQQRIERMGQIRADSLVARIH